jgi:diguanylate cyclase (GGDEF)-like protein/PAS domain S-box-containing protein
VAVAITSRNGADVHRRAQVAVEQLRTSAQALNAFKWRANTETLAGTADFSFTGPLVRDGRRIMDQLGSAAEAFHRLQPGIDSRRLRNDVDQIYAASIQQMTILNSPKRFFGPRQLDAMQRQFQPLLDRLDGDATRAARHQQGIAAGALETSLLASIGSLLLGVGVLGALGWRLARLTRQTKLAGEVREIERRSEQRIRALVEHSSDVVSVLDADLRVRWQAPSVRRLLGIEPRSLEGEPVTSLVHPEDHALFQSFLRASIDGRAPSTLPARFQHADGRWCHVETVAESRFGDPAVEGLVLNMRDISERKAFEDELRRAAFHDALTGLANRALFEDRLRHALASRLRGGGSLAVLFLDLDDFKTINDSLGHRAGDGLLTGVAARIDSFVRPTDTAARFGGDEFAVLLDGVTDKDEAQQIAGRILQALTNPFVVDDRALNITASVGIALADQTVDADELLRNADMAMYAAKASGKNSVHAFEEAMHQRVVERLELRFELTRALEESEFELHYQPIVALDTGRIMGVEALVRWRHPSRGMIAPDMFIGLAEETGLIVPLGQWVLEEACAQVRAWARSTSVAKSLYVSVNISIRQLQEPGLPEIVADVLARTGLDPGMLVLEITEGRLAEYRESIVTTLESLKRLGVRIAIDDFGTGYSALSHIQQFPVDILKIDKSFVDLLHTDPQKASLVQGIINLGESLHLDVIAEGIEKREQAEALLEMRSSLGQGFLFSRPVAQETVIALLQRPSGVISGT